MSPPHTVANAQKPSSCSIHEARRLSSPFLVLESQSSPGELLVFSLQSNLEEAGFNTDRSSREDGLASKNERKQAKSKAPFFSVLCRATTRGCGPDLEWDFFPPQII